MIEGMCHKPTPHHWTELHSRGSVDVWAWRLSGCPPGKASDKQVLRVEKAGTCGRGAARPTPAPQGSTRLLTEHQNVLAGRQLGSGAGGHFAQDRRPAATTTRVVSAGPPRTAGSATARQCLPTVLPAPARSLPGRAIRGSVRPSP